MNWSTDPFPTVEELAVDRTTPVADVAADRRATEAFDAARHAGHAQGFAEGLSAGRDEAIASARPDVSFALTALTEAIEDLHQRDCAAANAVAEQTVELAFAIAEAVIGRELQLASSPGRDAIARAMRVAPDRGAASARLHPIDVATLRDTDHLVEGRSVEIVADDTVERGGCIMAVGATSIDAQLTTALQRVHSELANAGVAEAVLGEEHRAELTVFEGGRS